MSEQKITVKHMSHNLPFMGKGNYVPVQNKMIRAVKNLLLPANAKQGSTDKLATNYL